MIAENTAIRDIVKEGIEETTKMRLGKSPEVEKHIIRVLSENYNYPIASGIRETSSNAYDSHLMNNTPDLPFHVRLYKNETGNYNLEIEDFGLGMDEKDFDYYYMHIGNSNKRGVAGVLGYYGAGCKSWLSYKTIDSYEVITRKNSMEYKFLVFRGEEEPEKLKIYEKPTTESNGVKVKVVIDRWDFLEVKEAIKQQLCYFPTAYIQIEGDNFDYINAKIFENDLFSWSEIYPATELHINFGKVRYPIDFKILKISPIYLPIGIKINPDGVINPFFNRESLEYTKEAKDIILGKITELANYFVNLYNEQQKDEYELLEVFNKITDSNKYVNLGNEEFKINDLLQYATITPKELKIKGIDIMKPEFYYNLRNEYLDEYETLADYNRGKWRVKHVKTTHDCNKLLEVIKHIEVNRIPTGLIKKFLLEKYTDNRVLFIKKVNKRRLGNIKFSLHNANSLNYTYILNLEWNDKQNWRSKIQEWIFVENQFKSLIINEINVENSKEYQEWLLKHKEHQKKNRAKGYSSGNYKTLNKKEGEVTISYCIPKSVGTGFKFDKNTYKIQELHKNKYLTILFTEEEKEKALNLRNLQSKWRIAIVGKNEGKKIENIHNFVTFKQFMEKSKPFKRLMTSFLFEKEVEKYDNIFRRKDLEIIQNCLKPLYNDIQLLKSYVSKNGKYVRDNELLEQMIEVAKGYNLYDYEFWTEYQNVKNSLQKYEFITLLQSPSHWNEEGTAKVKSLINQILFHQQKYRGLHNELEIVIKPKESVVEEETILEQEMETV